MYIEEKVIEPRILDMMDRYKNCNDINDVWKIYKGLIPKGLRQSCTEIYCLTFILKRTCLWYSDEYSYDKLYDTVTQNGFFDTIEEIKDTQETNIIDSAHNIKDIVMTDKVVEKNDNDIWDDLWNKFSDDQKYLLRQIVENANPVMILNDMAKNQHIMPELLVDQINEISLEIIGDNIIEYTDELEVYEDYKEEIEKRL